MKEVAAKKVLYIKLGREGDFEKECIENGVIKLDYRSVPDDMGRRGNKQEIVEFSGRPSRIAASNDARQIITFYHEPEDTLWITFWNDKLWWCFADKEVEYDSESGTKTRKAIGGWKSQDIKGNELNFESLSGALLRTKAYRGTICEIRDERRDYLLGKINGHTSKDIDNALETIKELNETLLTLIRLLNWDDFELLVDLIFRRAGWIRNSEVGGTQKLLDLDLEEPLLGRKAMVQVKSQSHNSEFQGYIKSFREKNENSEDEYALFFYFVHTSLDILECDDEDILLFEGEKIAELCVTLGLVDWVIKRALNKV